LKQHITVKQLKELSEKGKKKLRKWCKKHILVDMSEIRTAIQPTKQEVGDLYNRKQEETMFLSIGQMIEFLLEEGKWRKLIWDLDEQEVKTELADSRINILCGTWN